MLDARKTGEYEAVRLPPGYHPGGLRLGGVTTPPSIDGIEIVRTMGPGAFPR